MARMTAEELEAAIVRCRAAVQRAKPVLKPGDLIEAKRCGGGFHKVKMAEWSFPGSWIVSARGVMIAPINIVRVNGKAVDFTKDGER